jgi:hypothetical protein
MISDFYIHTATVETFTGTGARGPAFAAPIAKAGFAEDGRKLVRNATGQEVVSETTWFTSLDDVALYTADSKVTVNGRTARVIIAKRRDLGALGPEVSHLEVNLA